MATTKSPKPFADLDAAVGTPTIRGMDAVVAARSGAPFFVLNPQTGWILADAATLARAERLIADGAAHATWIYGANAWRAGMPGANLPTR